MEDTKENYRCSHCKVVLTDKEIAFNADCGTRFPPRIDYCRGCWDDYVEHAITGN